MSAFHPQCTLPPPGTNFVASPPYRGTLQILWTCLSVLILCTWSIQHLNIPIQARPTNKMQEFRKRLYLTTRKLKWMTISIFAPEIIFGIAVGDYIHARCISKAMHPYAAEDDVEWSPVHSHFTNMGGFIVIFPSNLEADDLYHGDTEHTTDGRLQSSPDRRSSVSGHLDTSGCSIPLDPMPPARLMEDEVITSERSNSSSRTENITPNSRQTLPEVSQDSAQGVNLENPWLESDIASRNWILELVNDEDDGFKAFELVNENDVSHLGPNGWRVSSENDSRTRRAKESEHYRTYLQESSLYEGLQLLRSSIWILDGWQLLYAREQGIINKLPNVSQAELEDQSNGDSLVKGVAVLQVCWLIIQLSIRAYRNLPIAPLEILALAFSASAFVTYLLLWSKPQDVMTARYITANRYAKNQELIQLAIRSPTRLFAPRRRPWMPDAYVRQFSGGLRFDEARWTSWKLHAIASFINRVFLSSREDMNLKSSLIWAIFFGSMHFFAWNSHFPTSYDRLLWRIGTVASASSPVVMLALLSYGTCDISHTVPVIGGLISMGTGFIYIVVRLIIMAEAFRSLFFLPPEAFVSTWTSSIPHLS